MEDSSAVSWLTRAIDKAARSSTSEFCVAGCLPNVDPGLEVDGVGPVKLPLKQGMAKRIIAAGQVAPFGKGARTLVDTDVRKTFELDPRKFRLGDQWTAAIAEATRTIAERLGLPSDRLEARLYKLLVYQRGGFFLPHRDSEKHDRMLASLVVVLPNRFAGGYLTVRHGVEKESLAFREAATGKSPCYAAFYADCEHEVKRIDSGVRLALTYNLVLKPQPRKAKSADQPLAPVDQLAESIDSWITARPGRPLVFALEHHYTQRGLSLDLLKGDDRGLANLVVGAAEKGGCLVHLAQIERHLVQFADDGDYSRGYRHVRSTPREIEIGEVYDDELSGREWFDVDGKRQPFGRLALDRFAIVSSVPLDEWEPTSEEYEGYTGNEGNTLDRWYHRSAIVLWHRDHHFDVVASAGPAGSIPLLGSMVSKLAKTPKRRLEEARHDAIRLARAIVARWPDCSRGYRPWSMEGKAPLDDFPPLLARLHDRDTMAMFLSKMATHDPLLSLKSLVVAACGEFGCRGFASEFHQLLSDPSNRFGEQRLSTRDAEWLAGLCSDVDATPDDSKLIQELCGLAAERFCKPFPPRSPSYRFFYQSQPLSVSEKSLPLLLKGLLAQGRDDDLSRVIHFVEQSPHEFRRNLCQVPILKKLVPWSRKRFGRVHPHLGAWLGSVRRQLEAATAEAPRPPTNWTRPEEVDCSCEYCAELKEFLIDSTSEVTRIAAAERQRSHLVEMINQHQCDVKHALERIGRPYSLVLKKTTGSFERAVKQFKTDQKLLSQLPTE